LGKFTGSEAKNITLVHRKNQLIDDRAYKKLATSLETKLRSAGVDLILGDEHVAGPDFKTGKQSPGTVIHTKEGKEISADFVFLAVGNSPNTQLIRDVDPSALRLSNLIKVNDQLQVQSDFFPTANVFAAGDCCDAPGWRSLISIDAEASTVITNIIASIGNGSLKKHKAGPRAMVVPLGENAGVSLGSRPLSIFVRSTHAWSLLLSSWYSLGSPSCRYWEIACCQISSSPRPKVKPCSRTGFTPGSLLDRVTELGYTFPVL
jgi:NADH dehydrogenase FAD-containing subunit